MRGAPDRSPPKERERNQGREDLLQSLDVIGLGISTDHGALLALEAVIRHHDRLPPGLCKHRICLHAPRVRLGLGRSSMFLDGVPRQSNAPGTSALGSVSQSERVSRRPEGPSGEHETSFTPPGAVSRGWHGRLPPVRLTAAAGQGAPDAEARRTARRRATGRAAGRP